MVTKLKRIRCKHCKTSFMPKREWQLFCCDTCRMSKHNKARESVTTKKRAERERT